LVGVYVDDLVITSTKKAEVEAFKEEMKATFQMSDLGLLSFYLGIEVYQDSSGISLRQTAYAKRIVELGRLTGCNPAHTPMEERLKLSRDSTQRRSMPRSTSALWAAFATSSTRGRTWRSLLATSVGSCSDRRRSISRLSRGSSATSRALLTTALHYPRCPGAEHFIGYSDNNLAGDIDTSKSTGRTLFFLGKCLISW
jgi:hypothetical protein